VRWNRFSGFSPRAGASRTGALLAGRDNDFYLTKSIASSLWAFIRKFVFFTVSEQNPATPCALCGLRWSPIRFSHEGTGMSGCVCSDRFSACADGVQGVRHRGCGGSRQRSPPAGPPGSHIRSRDGRPILAWRIPDRPRRHTTPDRVRCSDKTEKFTTGNNTPALKPSNGTMPTKAMMKPLDKSGRQEHQHL